MKTIFKRLRKADIEKVLVYMNCESFNVGNVDDYWAYKDIKNWIGNKKDCCVGAFIDNKLTGFCLTHYHKQVKKVHLENIYVINEERRKGIGSELVSFVEKYYCNKYGNNIRFVALINYKNKDAIELMNSRNYKKGVQMIWVQKNG